MALIFVVLPLAEITFLTPPHAGGGTDIPLSSPLILIVLLLIVLGGLGMLRSGLRGPPPSRRRSSQHNRNRRPPTERRGDKPFDDNLPPLLNPILVDGSNVMHWKDGKPQIMPVQSVVHELRRRGFAPGVVFDANAGHKLAGRYLNEKDFATMLSLPASQVFVVPKGTQADPYLLDAARGYGARIVTHDRFKDWAEAHPEVKEPGFLVRGGYRSNGEFWLGDATPVPGINTA
jgi:Zc3h12a-like Ribonuclease NYN domain